MQNIDKKSQWSRHVALSKVNTSPPKYGYNLAAFATTVDHVIFGETYFSVISVKEVFTQFKISSKTNTKAASAFLTRKAHRIYDDTERSME